MALSTNTKTEAICGTMKLYDHIRSFGIIIGDDGKEYLFRLTGGRSAKVFGQFSSTREAALPNLGDRVFFISAPPRVGSTRWQAILWARIPLAAVQVATRPSFVTSQRLAKKHWGIAELRLELEQLGEQLSQAELQVFYERSPNGERLWADFQTKRDALKARDREFTFLEYAKEIARVHFAKYLFPKSCMLDHREREMVSMSRSSRLLTILGPDGVIAAHHGKQVPLKKMLSILCRDCDRTKCKHHRRKTIAT